MVNASVVNYACSTALKFCETKALQYVDVSAAAIPKKRDLAEKILMEVSQSEAP